MNDTDLLIARLAADARPVRRLRPPPQRAAGWIGLTVALVMGLAALHGLRPDLTEAVRDPGIAGRLAGAALTGGLAAVAALMLAVPGRSGAWALLPLPALALWWGSLGTQCLTDWVQIGVVDRAEMGRCLATVLLTGVPGAALLLLLLHRAAPLRRIPVLVLAGLAVAGTGTAALTLLHAIDASAMVIAWNLGVVVLAFSGQTLAGWIVLRHRTEPLGTAREQSRGVVGKG